jgi:hypothetical protein
MYCQRNVYGWLETFKYGRTNVSDEARSGRPSFSRNRDDVERADVFIQEDGRITVSEVAEMLDIKLKSVFHSRKRMLSKIVLLHHYNSRHPWCGRNNRDNSKPQVGGSATSTTQFRPHTMRLLSLCST